MSRANPAKCPLPTDLKLGKDGPVTPQDMEHMHHTPYREAIGSLMYLAVATHLDIAFVVLTLSQFLDNPGVLHWEAAKKVFRYILVTKTTELVYGSD